MPPRRRKYTTKTVTTEKTSIVETTTQQYTTTSEYYNTTESFLQESLNYSSTLDLNLDFENFNEATKATIVKRAIVTSTSRQVKNKRIICRNARRFRSSRERWWFLAISNCNGSKGIRIKYKILMTNGPQGDYWHEHFSADEFCKRATNNPNKNHQTVLFFCWQIFFLC